MNNLAAKSALAFGATMGVLTGASYANPEAWPTYPHNLVPSEESADPAPLEQDEMLVRIIEIHDETIGEPGIANRELRPEYYHASELLGRASLGKIEIEYTQTQEVTLYGNIGEKMCALTAENLDDTSLWDTEMLNLQTVATAHANNLDGNDAKHYDATIYDFGQLQICPPGGRFTETGYESAVAGNANLDGVINIFQHGRGTDQVIAHELLHSEYELGHAHLQECSPNDAEAEPVDRSGINECYVLPYGDLDSVMGAPDGEFDPDELSGHQLARIDALRPNQIVTVNESGTYDLNALLNDGNGPKLLFIPDNEHWLGEQITDGTKDSIDERDYAFEPDEGFYVEVNSIEDNSYFSPESCSGLTIEQFDRSPDCAPREVAVRVFRAAELGTERNGFPATVAMDLNSNSIATYADDEREGQTIFQHNETRIELVDIQSSPDGDGTGSAQLKITLG